MLIRTVIAFTFRVVTRRCVVFHLFCIFFRCGTVILARVAVLLIASFFIRGKLSWESSETFIIIF